MSTRTRRRRRRRLAVTLTVVVLVVAAIVGTNLLRRQPPPGCVAVAGGTVLSLDLEQAANASTIAAEAIRLHLPARAVTVALAAALQESGLHNLPYGDRDSVGLFQQRPSEGWGPRASLMQPTYAAVAFYRQLVKVPGWTRMDPGAAAQLVQRSATPGAYTPWDQQAGTLAEVLTGQVPAGLACQFTPDPHAAAGSSVQQQAVAQLGAPASRLGWAGAVWVVAHASDFGVHQVAYAGRVWSAQSGRWAPSRVRALSVQVAR